MHNECVNQLTFKHLHARKLIYERVKSDSGDVSPEIVSYRFRHITIKLTQSSDEHPPPLRYVVDTCDLIRNIDIKCVLGNSQYREYKRAQYLQ
jgi:hypothetical protein